MIVRKLRLQRGWSQEHLAQVTGISVRTIQRIERGCKPGLESAKSLAAVFEVDISVFNAGETTMNEPVELKNDERETMEFVKKIVDLKNDEREAMEFVKGIKGFYEHLAVFMVFVILEIFGLGWDAPLHDLYIWCLAGWGVGVVIHGLVAYEVLSWFFTPKWEKKLIEKRLGRKL